MDIPHRPDLATLADWVEGRLDDDAAARVADAVAAGDRRTTAMVAWLRRVLATAHAMPLCEVPPIVRQRLGRDFARWSTARAALSHQPTELRASVLFDSRLDLALAGTRGDDGADEAAHVAYTTDRADVVLDIRRNAPGSVDIDGQVLLIGSEGGSIFEASVDTPVGVLRTVDGDALGRFALPAVPDDATELRVTNGELVIVVPLRLSRDEPMQ